MQTVQTSRRFTPAVRLLIAFFAYEISNILLSVVISLLFPSVSENENIANIARLVMGIVLTVIYFFLTKHVDRRPFSVLKLTIDANAVKSFIISFILTGIIVLLAYFIGERYFLDADAEVMDTSWKEIISILMAAFVLQGIPEEVAFRGYMPQTFVNKPIPTFLVTSVLFMLFHWHFILQYKGFDLFNELYYAFIFGALAFILRYLFQSTWAAIGVHGGIHVFRNIAYIYGFHEGLHLSPIKNTLMTIVVLLLLFINWNKFKPSENKIKYE